MNDRFNIEANFGFDSIVSILNEWVDDGCLKESYTTIENYSTVLVLLLELNIKQ